MSARAWSIRCRRWRSPGRSRRGCSSRNRKAFCAEQLRFCAAFCAEMLILPAAPANICARQRSRSRAMVSVRQIHPLFAAEVTGVDLASLTPGEVATLQEASNQYAVLVFPGQTLDDDRLLNLG